MDAMAIARDMTAGEAKDAVRAWVTGADHRRFDELADGTVLCQVTHSNLKQNIIELRFDLHSTVRATKNNLYTYNGTNREFMELQLFEGERLIARMLDDDKMLGFYGMTHGHRVHVVDHDPMSLSRGGGLDDVSQVKKYVMSEADYDKREGTLRAWKREQLKKNPHFKYSDALPASGRAAAAAAAGPRAPDVDYEDDTLVEGMDVGARCSIRPGERRGTVAFVGKIDNKTGWWVGVRLDEPLGKTDGTASGKRYFDAEPGYATFIRPTGVTVGDFPPIDEELGEPDEAGADSAAAAGAAAGAAAASAAPAAAAAAGTDVAAKEDEEAAAAAVAAAATLSEAAAREAATAKRAAARPSALHRRPGDDDFADDDDDDEL